MYFGFLVLLIKSVPNIIFGKSGKIYMQQKHWTNEISDIEKESEQSTLFDFRLQVTRSIFYALTFLFVVVEAVLVASNHNINFLRAFVIILINAAGLALSYKNPRKMQSLFFLIPIYCLVAAETLSIDLVTLFGEIFTVYYVIMIAINYVLCSSTLALIYSFVTILTMVVVCAEHGFDPRIFGPYYISYFVTIAAQITAGFIIAAKYEKNYKITEFLNKFDDITGLLNKNGFIKELKKAVVSESRFFFVFINADNFSESNDESDPEKSQEILKLISANLATIPDSFVHSRFYNGRFAFISRTESALLLTAHLDKFERNMKEVLSKHSLGDGISFSEGIVSYPEQTEKVSLILDFAEISLNKSMAAKIKGETAHSIFFTNKYLDERERFNTIQKDIFSACRNGELQVFYQPKVSLVEKRVTGMEALARWTHPQVGYIPPDEFVSIAEKSGNIFALGEYVIESALYHIKQVHQLCSEDISISINISPLQLMKSGFTKNILSQAQNFGIEPSIIYLEITEGTMLKNESQAILKKLKEMGFNLSLDDFGTGYSSLNYLHKYDFDELKIDKSFTDGLMRGRNERRLFKFLILLAKELGMKTVTEGVEDEVQIRLLQGLGAQEIQGWYYSKALSSFDCIEFVKNFVFNDEPQEISQLQKAD